MSPTFHHNDYVISFSWYTTCYNTGDVVIVNHPDLGILIKRIAQIDHQNRVLLTGDNPASIDSFTLGWQSSKALVGKVCWHIAATRTHES